MTKSAGDEGTKKSRSKVMKLIHQYDIPEVGDELEAYWTAETDDRMSLRELATYFNKALLTKKLQENAPDLLEGEADNYYRLLTDDNVSSGTRIQAENRLEEHDMDVEQLRDDFVSRQAIHTFLTSEREVVYEHPSSSHEDRIHSRIKSIRRLKNRLAAVVEQAIAELVNSESNSEQNASVTVLIQVQCAQCGTQHSISEFLTNDGCNCDSER